MSKRENNHIQQESVELDKSNNTLDSASEPVSDEIPVCPQDIKAVLTSEGALSRPWVIGDFAASKKRNIHIRGYVDFYGGYANHCREVILGLEKTGRYNIKLTPIECPVDIHPDLWSKMNWYTKNPAFNVKDSVFLVVAGPGHLQKKFLPKDRKVVGWTMVETLGVQDRIVEWCNNADLILCPTDIDVKRMSEAGVKRTVKVPIGYDNTVYHKDVEPLDIVNLRNRYVFGFVGSWNYRKGIEDIVHAYCMQFDSDDPVSLLLVSKYGNRPYGEYKENTEQWGIRTELQACIDKLHMDPEKIPHITVLDVPLHPPVIPHVYSRINCLVGFSMGESTWLPGLELGAMGKPIIQLSNMACGYMEYLENTRYMCGDIEYVRCSEKLYHGTSEYYEGEKMGRGNVLELQEMMGKVYRERETIQQKVAIKEVQERVCSRTWDNSIKRLAEVLNSLY